MHNHHNRTITLSKKDLIAKIKENKENHIKEYNEAIIAYKEEAQKQIDKAIKDLEESSLKINMYLITPVNISDEYDKVIEMFNWEIKDEIILTQSEFNEYVHDDTQTSKSASLSNTSYNRSKSISK